MAAPFESYLLTTPPYSGKVTVLIGGTREELMAAFKRRRISAVEAMMHVDYCMNEMKHNLAATIFTTRPNALFVYFPKRPDLTKPKAVDTVAHELLHCVISILKTVGVRLGENSEEAYTYLMGKLMQDFWTKVGK